MVMAEEKVDFDGVTDVDDDNVGDDIDDEDIGIWSLGLVKGALMVEEKSELSIIKMLGLEMTAASLSRGAKLSLVISVGRKLNE